MKAKSVIVVGGGIGGLTTALAFACKGLDVTILERARDGADVPRLRATCQNV